MLIRTVNMKHCRICGIPIYKTTFDEMFENSIFEDLCEKDKESTSRILNHLNDALSCVSLAKCFIKNENIKN